MLYVSGCRPIARETEREAELLLLVVSYVLVRCVGGRWFCGGEVGLSWLVVFWMESMVFGNKGRMVFGVRDISSLYGFP